jgi:endonuclease/exonuclease/phosphatase family metal-dependent hydrolase
MVMGKSTTMRVYIKSELVDDVIVYAVVPFDFGKKEGSKGANGICMRVFDTTVALVNCHLTASIGKAGALQKRQKQYASVVDVLGNKLGNEYFQLNGQFHHIVWMGDLNYRLAGLEADTCVTMLQSGQLQPLHDKHDELALELGRGSIYMGYTEAEKDWANFYPSYKKNPDRPAEDASDPDFVGKTYMVDYKQQLYKGGKRKTRMPSWTDRILVRSQSDCAGKIQAGDYRAITSQFLTSDHSPVQAILTLKAKKIPEMPPCMYKMRLHNVRIHNANGSAASAPAAQHLKVVAPTPFEVDADRPATAKKVEMADVQPGKSGKAWFFTGIGISAAVSDVAHHVMLKVNLGPTLKGECTVAVRLADFVASKTCSFTEPLEYDGISVLGGDTQKLCMSFDLELFNPAGPGPAEGVPPEPEPEGADDE